MTAIFDFFAFTGFGPLFAFLLVIASLGVYKFVKDWLPW